MFLTLFPAPFVSSVRKKLFGYFGGPTRKSDTCTGKPIFYDSSQIAPSQEELHFAASSFEKIQPDAVFLDTIFCAPYCGLIDDTVTKYVITNDVVHERHQTFVDQGYDIKPRQVTAKDELKLLKAFDAIIAIQPHEAKSFESMRSGRDILTTPYSVTLTTPDPADEVPGRCPFVGIIGLHNVDGLRWFLSQVWPTVVQHLPKATLHVCGGVCEEVHMPLQGVVYQGEVNDLREEYSNAALVVVPLRAGSALKIKIVEALSHARACVTTSIGAQGLPRSSNQPFVVIDDDARNQMSAGAHEWSLPYTAEPNFKPLIERGL